MHTFTTPDPIATVLDIPAGRVRFIAADRSDTTVEVLPADASSGRDAKAAARIEVAYGDGVLWVRAAEPEKRILGHSGSVEVTVQLPSGSSVEATAAAAELRGVGRLGDVAFEGAQATVKLDEAGSTRLNLQAGDVTVGRLGGTAEISTRKGDIDVTEAVRGSLTLRTEHGRISVAAARGASATLDAGTSFGRVHNSLQNTGGTPDLEIHATTSYGDITARAL
ncbi:DUF4097 family beta strand repeat-containing protein [Nocardiopsis trehalosi]|uniref:DUF4097 family beta strand repeat-containing protein n=1 Tax=Nocardiopsis trehalosi TaxID=109329 RepID=UPI00082BE42A|nr:DUF4097 family beta strand repeat-containing protein [Nocardiopsis trehalosi]